MQALKDWVDAGIVSSSRWFVRNYIIAGPLVPDSPERSANTTENESEEEPEPEKIYDLFILFGSQTGTAEDVAERVAREGMKFGRTPFVASMDEFGVHDFVAKCSRPFEGKQFVIFIASTTGQGDPPDNMKVFWKTLCRTTWEKGTLDRIHFGVIALGDSSYEKYNFVGKKLNRRLKQLGGNEILEVCLGDDQHDLGYHAAVTPWLEKLWATSISRRERRKLEDQTEEQISKLLECDEPCDESEFSLEDDKSMEFSRSVERQRVIENIRVTSKDHWQNTRLIKIDLEGSSVKFSPGDILTTIPSNLPKNVEKFFEIFPDLNNQPRMYFQKNPRLPWSKISKEILVKMPPQPWSWEEIVSMMLDIQSVPRRYFFELMSQFADNELEKEKLSEFCTPEGQEELFSYCNRPKKNILEVLEDFPNTTKNIPPIFLFDLIPTIKPRSFSIASSQKALPNSVQILVAVVEYQTQIKAKRKGLCSNWLAHHCPGGTKIPIWIQKGSFKFPPSNELCSIIMIGPGTGVAPFRSLITESLKSVDLWDKWMFFGCRNEAMDYYFEKEWKQLEKRNLKHFHFRCAFSRDSEGLKREYVQDKLFQESKTLAKMIASKNFYIYVAGNSKDMPKDVHGTILQILMNAGMDDAERYLELCSKRLGRYQTETWA